MRATWRWVGIVALVGLVHMGLANTAAANPSTEDQFLQQINSSRAAAGLAPLTVDSNLRSYARTHSQFMADGNCPPKSDGSPASICHSTSAQLQAAAGTGWSQLGENVGRGNKDTLHDSFMNSSPHRANILGDYNYVGIGTVFADSTYVTVVFMKKGTTSTTTTTTTTKPASTAPKAPATTTTVPTTTTAPTTTTTTVPTTTTTTIVVGPDHPVTPGGSCHTVTRFWWVCQD
jgi:hypothetical protein